MNESFEQFTEGELKSIVICGHTQAPWLSPCGCNPPWALGDQVEVHEVIVDGHSGYLVMPTEDHTVELHPEDPGPTPPEEFFEEVFDD